MAELNIDASLVKNTSLLQSEERLISMDNGCICCTLREDLLVEVSRLAASRAFDYLIIESTGISEPQQVAETFAMQLPEEMMGSGLSGLVESEAAAAKALHEVARLDTCVTVVDAAELRSNA
jgi:G3E family GTPase